MQKIKTAILISGRGSNMQALVNAAKNPEYPAQISLVISNKENAAGLEFATQNGIKTAFINHKDFSNREEFDREVSKTISENDCQIVCLAGFMRLVSAWFVNQYQGKMINIHPSILPNFKGVQAVEDALEAKATKTGCTTHFVSEEMDSGKIIMQAEVEVLKGDDKEALATRILKQEHIIYPESLAILCNKFLI
ncbi:MAG: phosphoribosylglycinamide formyltransferase-1 [Myxococcota bacterium]|jgi:phosphoribosylglycinamide formyltransferase-1